jgi:autotransporter-associated beta strand protein
MKKTVQIVASLICFALGGDSVNAAVKYWDIDGATAGAGGATPSGTWDTGTNANWTQDSTGSSAAEMWAADDSAVFSAGTDAVNPFSVTVSGNPAATGITFEEGVATLTGGTIAMNATPFPMVVNANAIIGSVLSGTGLTKTGTGTLTLNGANTYTNVTTVSAGVLAVGSTNGLGVASANTVVSSGATLEISGGIRLGDNLALFGAGAGGAGALRSTSGINTVGFIQFDSLANKSARINSDAGSTLTIEYALAGNKFALTIGGDGDTITDGTPTWGFFWPAEGGGVTKEGLGTLTINGLVNSRGTLRVTGGTVKMGASDRFGNSGNTYPDLVVNGTFDMNGFNNRVDGLSGAGSVINAGTSTLIIGNSGGLAATHVADPDFTGVISGGTTLQKEGPRTNTLSGNNTYTGDTLIKAGTLKLGATGSISNTPTINVNSNATFDVSAVTGGFVLQSAQTLKGSGTIVGNVTANGNISPGASIGTLTFNNRLMLAGDLLIEVSKSASPSNDVISVVGTLTNAGVGTVTVTNIGGTDLAAGDSFRIFNQGVSNALALSVVSAGDVVWTNKLAVDGSIAVLSVPLPNVPATNLTIVVASPTSISLGGLGAANSAYGVYASTNLTTPMTNWWLIGTTNSDAGGLIQFVDEQATNDQRFYRFGQ